MTGLDGRILLALRDPADLSDPIGPPWLLRAALDITALGGHTLLSVLVLSVTVLLVLERRRATAAWLVMAVAGAMLLNHALKVSFARGRPDLVEHLAIVITPSFPSGHALMSAAVYLLLGALLCRGISRPARGYVMGLAVALVLLIGVTRVYLGVHWPTDVLAGWVVGALWAWICWRLGRNMTGAAKHGDR